MMSGMRAKMNVEIDTMGFHLAVDDDVPIAAEDTPGIPEHVVEAWLNCGLARAAGQEATAPKPPEHTATGAIGAAPAAAKPKRSRKAKPAPLVDEAPLASAEGDAFSILPPAQPVKSEAAAQGDVQ